MRLFETLPYEVIEKHNKIELRVYPDFLLAETKTSLSEKMTTGFMNVFNNTIKKSTPSRGSWMN
ncbi:heme-binding protein [Acholeplasma vituli]|uniref:Heme-binding protein n=1 Tax=Paracholeplasma vituli TaxID=69473 RepID=A0ABT2PZL2_9MOLU|nr:heme-binding protein [Paracholeplasma vituli]MCU0105157.1 heme-binding protein [Paracholeplasma vituli]